MKLPVSRACAVPAAVVLTLGAMTAAKADPIINGTFETGDLTGWTTFITSNGGNGTLGTGFPLVVLFDTNNDGSTSLAAQFRVGKVNGNGGAKGGGIFQSVSLFAGSLWITADIAALGGSADNAAGGFFELLLDGVVEDSHDFGSILAGASEHSTLSYYIDLPADGTHEIRIRMTRGYTQSASTPTQYIDKMHNYRNYCPMLCHAAQASNSLLNRGMGLE